MKTIRCEGKRPEQQLKFSVCPCVGENQHVCIRNNITCILYNMTFGEEVAMKGWKASRLFKYIPK